MKTFRLVLSLVFLFALTSAANAYRINILDPYSTNQIYSQPFSVVLATCQPGQTPLGFTPAANSGCFTGQNLTGGTITELQIVFPNQGAFANQTLECDATSASIFTGSTCAKDPTSGNAIFTFTGLSIGIYDSFLIYEEGFSPSNTQNPVPAGTGGYVSVGTTPEPSSFLLLGTGLAGAGAFRKSRWFFSRG